MAETHADDPTILASIEASRRSTRHTIRAHYNSAVALLEANFARLHREARQDHDARQTEFAAMELRNEMLRYELECQ